MTGNEAAREQILKDYKVSDHGVIHSPGKFEGEMLYVPYFHARWGEGGGDEEFGSAVFFVITPWDVDAFPELAGTYGLALEETDQGFVNCASYDTETRYLFAVEEAEAAESELLEDDDNIDPMVNTPRLKAGA